MNELLTEILAAREARVAKQKELLEKYNQPLLCFTMNIPGPVKYDRDVAIGFAVGNWLLRESLKSRKVLHQETVKAVTGAESYYVVEMPPKELEVLYFLASHPNQLFTRGQLLDRVWGYDIEVESRTVDVHVKRLRDKLLECEKHGWGITTIWRRGYKFEVQ